MFLIFKALLYLFICLFILIHIDKLYLFVVISFYVNLFFIRLTNKRKGNVQMTNSRLQMMIATALFTAIIGILAQITIPLPFIPITGQTLAIGLAATILGARYSN